LSDGQKKKYIEMFGSFTEPFQLLLFVLRKILWWQSARHVVPSMRNTSFRKPNWVSTRWSVQIVQLLIGLFFTVCHHRT